MYNVICIHTTHTHLSIYLSACLIFSDLQCYISQSYYVKQIYHALSLDHVVFVTASLPFSRFICIAFIPLITSILNQRHLIAWLRYAQSISMKKEENKSELDIKSKKVGKSAAMQ